MNWKYVAHNSKTAECEILAKWTWLLKDKIWTLWLTRLFHADVLTYLCCLTNRTSEPEPGKHAAFCMRMHRRLPGCNERDILMAFHLFMPRKWRGTVTFWNGWQNKEPTLGKWLYLWFHSDTWGYQERDGVTHFWQFKVLNDVMYGNMHKHGGTRSYTFLALRLSASRVQTWEQTEDALVSADVSSTVYRTVYTWQHIYIHVYIHNNLAAYLRALHLWFTDASSPECSFTQSLVSVLPIAPPSSSLTTVNHCVHTQPQVDTEGGLVSMQYEEYS